VAWSACKNKNCGDTCGLVCLQARPVAICLTNLGNSVKTKIRDAQGQKRLPESVVEFHPYLNA
jgi:hypothetical protein